MTDDQFSEIHQALLQSLSEADPQEFDANTFMERFGLSSPWFLDLQERLMKADPPIGCEAPFPDQFSRDPRDRVRFSRGSHISGERG